MRYLHLFIAILVAAFIGTADAQNDSQEFGADRGVTLDSVLHVISRHPLILKRSAEVDAARLRISQRSSLGDPMAMLGVENLPTNSFRFDEEPMTSKMIGITQMFPFFGKLSTERSIAEKEVYSLQENSAEEENRLRRDIRLAFYDIYHLEQSIETNRNHLKSIAELIDLSEHAMAVGKGTQQDVLALKLENAETRLRIPDEESMISMRLADLAGASNMVITQVRPDTASDLPKFDYDIAQLDSLASLHRPALLAMYSETEASGFEIEKARLMKYPDFSLGLFYMQRDAIASMKQSDMVSAQLSFNLPIFSRKFSDAVSEQEAMRTAKHEEINAMKLEIHTMLESLLRKMEGLSSQFFILKQEILPLSLLSLATSRSNLQNGKATLNEVLRSELAVLHYMHSKYQLQADYNKAIAQIEYLVGIDLTIR
ncbi:MAG: TolC family protein [Bacteroidota bacterium]|nr:TolC family protein [Bacteroidota bacterium]MDP4231382.1 TolC family protein [Bacteroidota bacterium]MDP4237452.1 TolC family protein [Bacteroidota bacterium]